MRPQMGVIQVDTSLLIKWKDVGILVTHVAAELPS